MLAISAFADMNGILKNLPKDYITYKCTSDNKSITRNIKNLTITEVEVLKDKLDKEMKDFEELYQRHMEIDNQCVDLIRNEMNIIGSDKKAKDVYTILQGRFQRAYKDASVCFSAVSDYGPDLKSVRGRDLYNFIMQYHRHKCIYTNHFKQCKGDTYKEIQRLQEILNYHYHSSIKSKEIIDKKEDDHIENIKNQIQSLDLDEEEW